MLEQTASFHLLMLTSAVDPIWMLMLKLDCQDVGDVQRWMFNAMGRPDRF